MLESNQPHGKGPPPGLFFTVHETLVKAYFVSFVCLHALVMVTCVIMLLVLRSKVIRYTEGQSLQNYRELRDSYEAYRFNMFLILIYANTGILFFMFSWLLLYECEQSYALSAASMIFLASRNFTISILFFNYSVAEFSNAKSQMLFNEPGLD